MLDSPVNENETQLEKACFGTEVMDNDDGDDYMGHVEDVKVEQVMCELDMEIVLDSEDEGSCRTETITLFNCRKITGGSEKNVSKKREGQSPCLDVDSIDKQLSAG